MSDLDDVITPTDTNSVWAERTGTRQYLAHNARGAEVRVGTGEGEFTPGELIKIALGTCNTLSADHRLAKALGEDFDANVVVATLKHDEEERYTDFDVQIIADFASLSREQRQTLNERVERAIERGCTVGHTIERGAGVRLHLLDDPDA
ncbi:OsmC family protein [Actinomyces ruminis]|uniref:Osmotically inducible protein OsmC n=1 Tax=Actinomyces ruminis TaxID=1937003 RepID=A0ABX4ME59_9ACTO|nr:OsmC family protein [Actinomyces ruminis]PHP53803.1 osmotically inducible protein OsmC [Actinomyces ruminis]